MKKKTGGLSLTPGAPLAAIAERWVGGATEPVATPVKEQEQDKPAGAVKRLTIDVPLDLHRRLKVKAATEGVKMADLVRDWIKEKCG